MPYSTRATIQAAIDALPRTSGVNGERIGGTVLIANTKDKPRIVLDRPLQVYPGVRLVGDGTGTVVQGDIELATYTGPDNTLHDKAGFSSFQLHGSIRRGKTSPGHVNHIEFENLDIFGGSIDLDVPVHGDGNGTVNAPRFISVAFHEWTQTCVKGNLRIARFESCTLQSDSTDAVKFPLIDLTGPVCTATFADNLIQPRGMWLRAIGGDATITIESGWIEPMPPKGEADHQTTTLPRMEIGTGTVIADRLDAMDCSPIILHGTTLRCDDQRAIDQWGGPIDASLAFVKTQN